MLAQEKFSYDTNIEHSLLSKKGVRAAARRWVSPGAERVADQVLLLRGRKGPAQAKAL
jgi:hypothetical protein